ncbi:MAG: hypothetical protein ACK5MK_03415 [Dysgonomonas sp.]
MKNNLFYPHLRRHPIEHYYNRNGDFYADYKLNYDLVSADCLKRCVYCDATERECGGDKFSLDHFRPVKIFTNKFNGILNIHPYNLYLSCQKCNVLKSSDWHGCCEKIDSYTYIDRKGYIDRFAVDVSRFISVDNDGQIISLLVDSPVDYMVAKLHLNRLNRVFLRKKRIVDYRVSNFVEQLDLCTDELIGKYKSGSMSAEDALKKIERLRGLQNELCQIGVGRTDR